MSDKRIFISDIHLGDDARYTDPVPDRRARFFPSKHRDRLLYFLEKQIIPEKNNIKDLVLLGDIFDTWVCPFDALPPTYDSIFCSQENKPVLDSLRQIAASNINLCYVNGNHDYDLTDTKIQKAIPGIITKPEGYEDVELGLYAEHGHRFTLFNQSYPDVANGLPIGACAARGAAAEALSPGRHGSTFGGNPLVSRAACTVLDIMHEEDLAGRAALTGGAMLERFQARLARHGRVREVRGRGLMIGIELDREAGSLKQAALDRGVLLNVTQERVVRLLPPLVIDAEQAEEIVEVVCTLIDELPD